jgi:outer membrane protein assembly factor BamB/DNA-directed RNA polymerase subunit RPC12/RpoP
MDNQDKFRYNRRSGDKTVATQEFNCPNCGAPLDYPGTGATMRCPYCETSVVVPKEIRGEAVKASNAVPLQHPPIRPTVITVSPSRAAAPTVKPTGGCLLSAIVVGVVLFIAAVTALPIILTRRASQMAPKFVAPTVITATAFPAPTKVPIPTIVPTSSYAHLVTTFGSSGIGAGLLNDARYITVDGAGTVYVADYQDGRIQAFDPDGKFLHSWQVGDAKTIIYGLAANQAGIVYVAYAGDIYRFEGSSGKALGKLEYEQGQEFGDLTALPDGGVLGAWYEGRWGIITSLEGHRDDLVWFDAEGKTVRRLESAISGQTDDVELDTILAVDGLGNVFALSQEDGEIFKFTSQGKFVDRISVQSNDPSQTIWIDCIAVDGQGRVYVGGSYQVTVFSPDGQFILSFKTKNSLRMMAFSPQGDLYTVSGDSVSRYSLGELP